MKISEVTIENFRSVRKQTIQVSDYIAFVGPNGSGKSTILNALRIFFRDSAGSPTDLLTLKEDDFHRRDTTKDISVTVTFSDLDVSAEEEFQHYYRHGKLIISAVATWDPDTKTAPVKQFGERLGLRVFTDFFKANKSGEPLESLRRIYASLQSQFGDLPTANTKPAMIKNLTEYEAPHSASQELIRSEDEFYGFSRGANRLQKFIQWVFIPAVKDASSEQLEAKKNALGILLERTVRSKLTFDSALAELRAAMESEFQSLLRVHEQELQALSNSLSQRVKQWAHPEAVIKLQWHQEASKYVSIAEPLAQVLAGEGDFLAEISRFGHGLQRSFLFALLQELSGCKQSGAPHLILACEEPELHQHPPQAKHLASVLQKLAEQNSQVLICTHSPMFISGSTFERVRLVRKDVRTEESIAGHVSFEKLSDELAKATGNRPLSPTDIEIKIENTLQPQVNEIFFSSVLLLVEGIEDEAYIKTYFTLLNVWDRFRALGCHLVPVNGKGQILQPLAIANLLSIPAYVVFDADGDQEKPDKRAQHEKDNLAIQRMLGIGNPDPFPVKIFHGQKVTIWPTNIREAIIEDIGREPWTKCEEAVRRRRGVTAGDLGKKILFIGSTLSEAWDQNHRSQNLARLCNSFLDFAESTHQRL